MEKNEHPYSFSSTFMNVHSTMFGLPAIACSREPAKRMPAKAMESVALPAPAFAFTTSVPASWIRLVKVSN